MHRMSTIKPWRQHDGVKSCFHCNSKIHNSINKECPEFIGQRKIKGITFDNIMDTAIHFSNPDKEKIFQNPLLIYLRMLTQTSTHLNMYPMEHWIL